jgi:sporulation protein YlmC with PRC-barrel domain
MVKVFAKNMSNKQIMATDGTEIGILNKIVMDVKNGKIEDLIIKPDIGLDTSRYPMEGQYLKIPFRSVRSVKDYIVVDRAFISGQV